MKFSYKPNESVLNVKGTDYLYSITWHTINGIFNDESNTMSHEIIVPGPFQVYVGYTENECADMKRVVVDRGNSSCLEVVVDDLNVGFVRLQIIMLS